MKPESKKKLSRFTLLAEAAAGALSGFSVSPFNVVVDRSIIEYTSGKGGLWGFAKDNLLTIFKTPVSFFTGFSFRWMYFVYSLTYMASNLAEYVDLSPDIPQNIQKLMMVFLVNTTTSLIKDKKYAIKYGKTVKPFPNTSLGLFFIRDLIAMASAFTLPAPVGKELVKHIKMSEENGIRIAQLTTPLVLQLFLTPLHLFALDLYNRPAVTLFQRYTYIRSIFTNALLLRMMRFLPAYGIGGIINTELRKDFKHRIVQE